MAWHKLKIGDTIREAWATAEDILTAILSIKGGDTGTGKSIKDVDDKIGTPNTQGQTIFSVLFNLPTWGQLASVVTQIMGGGSGTGKNIKQVYDNVGEPESGHTVAGDIATLSSKIEDIPTTTVAGETYTNLDEVVGAFPSVPSGIATEANATTNKNTILQAVDDKIEEIEYTDEDIDDMWNEYSVSGNNITTTIGVVDDNGNVSGIPAIVKCNNIKTY